MILYSDWIFFPIGIIISSIAMATGLEGGMFWAPVYYTIAKLEPSIAVGMALVTKAFGFTSGLISHWKQGKIDWIFGGYILLFSVPSAMIGTYIGFRIDAIYLKLLFAVVLVIIGYNIFMSVVKRQSGDHQYIKIRCVRRPSGKFSRKLFFRNRFQISAVFGGFLLGIISMGLGPLLGHNLITNRKENMKVVVSTSVFVVAVTTYFSAILNMIHGTSLGLIDVSHMLSILFFAVPGVIIGAKFGTVIAHKTNPVYLKKSIAIIALLFGYIILVESIYKLVI